MLLLNFINLINNLFFFSESFSNLPPRITDSKPIIQREEGSTVELPCAAQGYPIPTIKWTKNNIPLVNTIDGRLNSDKKYIELQGSLRIRKLILNDAGNYRCFVNNSVGSEMVETQLVVTSKSNYN